MYHFGDRFGGWVMTRPIVDYQAESAFNVDDYEAVVNNLMALRSICSTKGIVYPDTNCFPNYPNFVRPMVSGYPSFFTQSYPLSYAIQSLAKVVLERDTEKASNMFTPEGLNSHNELIYEMWVALGGEE